MPYSQGLISKIQAEGCSWESKTHGLSQPRPPLAATLCRLQKQMLPLDLSNSPNLNTLNHAIFSFMLSTKNFSFLLETHTLSFYSDHLSLLLDHSECLMLTTECLLIQITQMQG